MGHFSTYVQYHIPTRKRTCAHMATKHLPKPISTTEKKSASEREAMQPRQSSRYHSITKTSPSKRNGASLRTRPPQHAKSRKYAWYHIPPPPPPGLFFDSPCTIVTPSRSGSLSRSTGGRGGKKERRIGPAPRYVAGWHPWWLAMRVPCVRAWEAGIIFSFIFSRWMWTSTGKRDDREIPRTGGTPLSPRARARGCHDTRRGGRPHRERKPVALAWSIAYYTPPAVTCPFRRARLLAARKGRARAAAREQHRVIGGRGACACVFSAEVDRRIGARARLRGGIDRPWRVRPCRALFACRRVTLFGRRTRSRDCVSTINTCHVGTK